MLNTLKLAETMIGVAALATGDPSLLAAKEAVGVIRDAAGLRRAITDQGLTDLSRRLAREAAARADDWARSPDHAAAARDAAALFEQALDHAVPRPEDLVGEALDAERVTALMLARLTAQDSPLQREFSAGQPARSFFEAVATPTLRSLLSDRAFVDTLGPALWRGVLERLERIETGRAADSAKLDRMLVLLEGRDTVVRAEAAGVAPEVIVRIARAYAPDVADGDVGSALRQIEAAIEEAIALRMRPGAMSNHGDLADLVLARMRERAARGDFEGAAREGESAWAAEEEAQAEERRARAARRIRLAEEAIVTDRLRNDPASAALWVERRMVASSMVQGFVDGGRCDLQTMLSEAERWREEGDRCGLLFDLEVSLRLGGAALERAGDPWQRAVAEEHIGFVHEILGLRLARPDLLEAALDCFLQAVAGFDGLNVERHLWAKHLVLQTLQGHAQLIADMNGLRDVAADAEALLEEPETQAHPTSAAAIHNTRGIALIELGHLLEESDPRGAADAFAGAIAAHEAALALTPEDHPSGPWPRRQQNLGRALDAAGRHEDAIRVYEVALGHKNKDDHAMSWAITKHNLATAWRRLGEARRDPAALETARRHALEAREIRTPEAAPREWAMTNNVLGGIELAYFEITGDRAALREAERLTRSAAPSLPARGSARALATADRHAELLAPHPAP